MLDITVKDGQPVIGEQALREITKLREFQVTKQEMENEETEIKQAIQDAMEQCGIKSFENNEVKITYTPEHIKKGLDTERMKAEGIYELYCKESSVKASVRITYR